MNYHNEEARMTRTAIKYGWLALKVTFLLFFVYHVAYQTALTY